MRSDYDLSFFGFGVFSVYLLVCPLCFLWIFPESQLAFVSWQISI
jgi:hypothetical protein